MLPHGPWGKTLDVLRRAHDRGGGGGERRRGKGWRGQDKKKLKKAPRDQKREWEDGEHDKEEGVRVKEDG